MPRETNSKRGQNKSKVPWEPKWLSKQEEKEHLKLMKKWAEWREMTTEETEQLNSYNKRSAESAKLYYEEVNHKIDLERELLTLTEKLIQELDLSPAERKRFHKVNDLFNNEKKKEQERRESLPWYIRQQRFDENEALFQKDLRELKGAKSWERMRNQNADFKSILDKDGKVIKTYFESLNNQVEGVDHWILNQMTVSLEGTATDDYVLSRMFMVDDT